MFEDSFFFLPFYVDCVLLHFYDPGCYYGEEARENLVDTIITLTCTCLISTARLKICYSLDQTYECCGEQNKTC